VTHKIYVPQVDVNHEAVFLVEWLVQAGAPVGAETTIAILETNKASVEVTADAEGFFYPQKEASTELQVGDLLAVVSEVRLEKSELANQPVSDRAVEQTPPKRMTAKARRLMQLHGLEESEFEGENRIDTDLVQRRLDERAAERKEGTDSRLDEIRSGEQAAALNETEKVARTPEVALGPMYEIEHSDAKKREIKAIAAGHPGVIASEVIVQVNWDHFQSCLREMSNRHEFPFSIGDMSCWLCGQLLGRYSELNGMYHAEKAYAHRSVHLGYALNLGQGLEVPVIRNADCQSLLGTAQQIRQYIRRYTRGELTQRDRSSATFTISDLSASGALQFRPVVSAMQSAILGIGMDRASRQINLILAFDHRMADGLIAARFLNELKAALEGSLHSNEASSEAHGELCEQRFPQQQEVRGEACGFYAGSTSLLDKLSELDQTTVEASSRQSYILAYKRGEITLDELTERIRLGAGSQHFKLSVRQEGFWALQKMTPQSTAYNAAFCFEMSEVHPERFAQACAALLSLHPVLGSVITEENGSLWQTIPKQAQLLLSRVDASQVPENRLVECFRLRTQQPFVLDEGPLCRIDLLSYQERKTFVLITIHHIIFDGYSIAPLVRTLLGSYHGLGSDGNEGDVRSEPYPAFVAWEEEMLRGKQGQVHRSYWHGALEDLPPSLELPASHSRNGKLSLRGATAGCVLSPELVTQIAEFAEGWQTGPSVIFLGCFATLLHLLSGREDIVVGMPTSGRPSSSFVHTVGCFMNMLPMRVRDLAEISFGKLIDTLKTTMLEGLYHGDYPFQQIVRDVSRRENFGQPPVFQVAFLYQDLPLHALEQTFGIRFVKGVLQEGQYELSLEILESKEDCQIFFKYDPELYGAATIQSMMRAFTGLMASCLASPLQRLSVHAGCVQGQELRKGNSDEADRAEEIVATADRQVIVIGEADDSRAIRPDLSLKRIEEELLAIWRTVIRRPGLGKTDRFFESGGDSVGSVLVSEQASARFGCELEPTTLFKFPTVQGCARFIWQSVGGESSAAATKNRLENTEAEVPLEADVYVETGQQGGKTGLRHVDRSKERRDDLEGCLAIVGISCAFPGASDQWEFWENLAAGKESAKWFSFEELRASDVPVEISEDTNYVPVLMSMEGKTRFDPGFFKIPVKNAELMDPQFRQLLMHSWAAVEDAGYTPKGIADAGVYMAASNAMYLASLFGNPCRRRDAEGLSNYLFAQPGTIPTMISYQLGLRGPSMFIGTNCSSSLVALHAAWQALQLGEVEFALVGAASLYSIKDSDVGYTYQEGMNFSKDGHCRAFDAGASGMVPGEGVGVVLVRRALDAVRDGDHVYALLRGIGVNNDGADKAGFYAPSVSGQSRLIGKVLERAGVHPDTISYVEAHGTGTKLGDPIEVAALSDAYRQYTEKRQYCGLGSVKGNVGHLDAAAGMAGLIKLALSLSKAKIPASVNFEQANPAIDFATSPFYVVSEGKPWLSGDSPRRGALSSFGIGGTNAHAILEAYEASDVAEAGESGPHLFPLSAHDPGRLFSYVDRIARFLSREVKADTRLADVAYTLQTGRMPMRSRVCLVASTCDELLRKLYRVMELKESSKDCYLGKRDRDLEMFGDDDEEVEALLQGWIAKEKWTKIARYWADGGVLDWHLLHKGLRRKRVSLPTYPFSQEPYGLPERGVVGTATADAVLDAKQTSAKDTSADTEAGCITLAPMWSPVALESRSTSWPEAPANVCVIGGGEAEIRAFEAIYGTVRLLRMTADSSVEEMETELRALSPVKHVFWIFDESGDMERVLPEAAGEPGASIVKLFRFTKALIASGFASREFGLTLVTTQAQAKDDRAPLCLNHAGVDGLAGSLAKEFPQWGLRVVDLGYGETLQVEEALRLPADPAGDVWAYRAGSWLRRSLLPVQVNGQGASLFKVGGVYVVIGGAGGLGEVFTRWVMERYQARVVWIGRRPFDETIARQVGKFSSVGEPPFYVQADATDLTSLKRAYRIVKERYSTIHGVVHSAVGLFDKSLSEAGEEHFRDVLAVKVNLCTNMARVFEDESLDLMVFFSSMVSFEKAAGMSGYSAGSCFEDAFARSLAARHRFAVKVVNWGYLNVGTGTTISAAIKNSLSKRGIRPLDPVAGMHALEAFLSGPLLQAAILRADTLEGLSGVQQSERLRVYAGISPPLQTADLDEDRSVVLEPDFLEAVKKSNEQNTSMEGLLAKLLWGTLETEGWPERVAEAPGIYGQWLRGSLDLLGRNCEPQGFSGLAAAWEEWEHSRGEWSENSDLVARVRLIEVCLRNLPAILRSEVDATSVLFPRGSMELVSGIYKNNRGADLFNKILSEQIVAVLEARLAATPAARFRILEIGAGTGGTSELLLRSIQPLQKHIDEYLYTDVSRAFLLHAEQHYVPEYPFVKTALLNIEEPLEAQAVPVDAYDIVVATNVLHATADIRRVLRHVKALMHQGAGLFLNEISDSSLFAHVTFGLLDGWWLAQDESLRIRYSPGLYPETWKMVLDTEGFASVSLPAKSLRFLGQQVIVAYSDGVVREWVAERSHTAVPNTVLRHDREMADSLHQRTSVYLAQLIAETIKVDPNEIGPTESLESYGLDSILFSQISAKLSKVFEGLSGTLFFEHATIDSLVEHLIVTQSPRLNEIFVSQSAPSAVDRESVRAFSPARKGLDRDSESRLSTGQSPSVQSSTSGKKLSVSSCENREQEPIAIIGVAAKFPDADNLAEYWRNLSSGRCSIGDIPDLRWPVDGFYEKEIEKAVSQLRSCCKRGAFLKGFHEFDPLFFNMSPLEVMDVDPQERLLLTSCWEALENSGYSRSAIQARYQGSAGVFIGVTKAGFNLNTKLGTSISRSRLPLTSFSSMANRVSYHLNFSGPSMAIDTMCSSGLTAVHEACQHIRRGECALAIAGAVNLYLHPRTYIDLSLAKMITDAPSIACFSPRGKGFIPGEAVGAIVLKRLDQAIADGDKIEGVILGTATNHGGKTNGYTVPSVQKQRELISEVLRRAQCTADEIDYIEAGANGSALGDRVELQAIRLAMETRTLSPCLLGTVKPNVGHSEAASGLAQLCKVLLQVKHERIVPSLFDADELYPDFPWQTSPFTLASKLDEWKPSAAGKRRALLTSVGAGGSNAAIVVEQYRSAASSVEPNQNTRQLIVFSARTELQRREVIVNLQAHLQTEQVSLSSLAYTLQDGREPLRFRAAVLVADIEELRTLLEDYLTDGKAAQIQFGDAKQLNSLRERWSAEEIRVQADRTVASGDLSRLAELWLQGCDEIDWSQLHTGKVRRCSLPTYPFERRQFWYTQEVAGSMALMKESPPKAVASETVVLPLDASTKVPAQRASDIGTHLIDELKTIMLLRTEDEVSADLTFFELGMDSISLVRFVHVVSEKLAISLPETIVFDYPTIGAFAQYLATQQEFLPVMAGQGVADSPPEFTDHLARVMKRYEEIVPLQLEGKADTLFCLHPMSGDAGIYGKLADASQKRFRVLGIRAHGFLTDKMPFTDLETMSCYCADIVDAVQPTGPLYLLGSSMGGTLAFDTARHLQLRGRIVAALLLVESPLVRDSEGAALWTSDVRSNLLMNANFLMISMLHMDPTFRERKAAGKVHWPTLEITSVEVAGVPQGELASQLCGMMRTRGVIQKMEFLEQRLESMAKVHLANLAALREYRAKPLRSPGEIRASLIRTSRASCTSDDVYNPMYLRRIQEMCGSMEPFLEGWADMLPDLEVRVMPAANHFELLNGSQAAQQLSDMVFDLMRGQDQNSMVVARTSHTAQLRSGAKETDIAIIGISGRFPDAEDVHEFWRNLKGGRCSVTEVPTERGWNMDAIYDPTPQTPKKTYTRHGAFLKDITCFDPLFFGISPREAALMDPSERIFLQEAWRAIEDAGYNPAGLKGKPWGVFACAKGDYASLVSRSDPTYMSATDSTSSGLLSYLLDVVGPAVSVDTACSSTLAAIAYACDSLVLGNCSVAIAGGGNVYTTPNILISSSQSLIYSPDGTCFSFDKRANGTVLGEAVAAVLLKPLSQAVQDRDHIYGVIEGWGTNQDGRTNGLAAPSAKSQSRLQGEVYRRFGIDPANITMVEAHGTGTKLGDPIEFSALKASFREYTDKVGYCALGTGKANIGHTFFAAGVVGLIKVLLSMQAEEIPPSLNFNEVNPLVDLENSPFFISTRVRPWTSKEGVPLTAAVSSFGATGTNVHLVVKQWRKPIDGDEPMAQLRALPILLSAKDEAGLKRVAKSLDTYVEREAVAGKAPRLADIAYTLEVGREPMKERAGFVTDSLSDLRQKLQGLVAGVRTTGVIRGQASGRNVLAGAFFEDEDLRKTVQVWMQNDNFDQLLKLWVNGVDVPWEESSLGQSARRISLPAYPFAKDRCWVKAQQNGSEPAASMSTDLEDGDTTPRIRIGEFGQLLYRPVWRALPVAGGEPVVQRQVFLCEVGDDFAERLPSRCEVKYTVLHATGTKVHERFESYAIQLFHQVRRLIKMKLGEAVLLQVVIRSAGAEQDVFRALSALLRTAHLEDPKLQGQLLCVEADITPEQLFACLEINAGYSGETEVRYRKDQRAVLRWEEFTLGDRSAGSPWAQGGVYLITGGAGALGFALAKALACEGRSLRLVLAGRSPLSAERQTQLQALCATGTDVTYLQEDIANRGGATRVIQAVLQKHHQLHGIFHAAGVIQDNFIINKTDREFLEVLGPKVAGLAYLDEASRTLPLDFLALFSSGASITGNVGQADYATANCFMDAYADFRNELVLQGQRFGNTLSINWPLWKEGGMKIDSLSEHALAETTGMIAMESEAGLKALTGLLRAGVSRSLLVSGDLEKIRQRVRTEARAEFSPSTVISEKAIAPEGVLEEVRLRLRNLLADIIQLGPERIAFDESLESYGIDSILINQINRQLSRPFPLLSKTLFYEHKTLEAVSQHLVEFHRAASNAWLQTGSESACTDQHPADEPDAECTPKTTINLLESEVRRSTCEPIAIIGLSGRFPGSADVEAFWDNLISGRSSISEIPRKRWPLDGFYEPNKDRALKEVKSFCKVGGFLSEFAGFDPLFFKISPRDVPNMDPHERWMLMSCWSAMEDAGYSPASVCELYGRQVGVFVGVTKTGFNLHTRIGKSVEESRLPFTSFSSIANRVSYQMDLTGPSMALDTMCSSSLTAIHEACEHIRRGDCRLALAGAANLYLHPRTYLDLCQARMLTGEDTIHCFSSDGAGFLPGEGTGAVLLKSLREAVQDGDQIRGVIRGSAVSHGGKTLGYGTPSIVEQEKLLRLALTRAELSPSEINYVESAANGNAMGDAIEFQALSRLFGAERRRSCFIGSVKPNIGHAEAAAGLTQVFKVLLQFQHKQFAPTLVRADRLDQSLRWDDSPFALVTEARPWPVQEGLPRRAIVVSHGAGGSYAALVLEEHLGGVVEIQSCRGAEKEQLFLFSARTETQLSQVIARMRVYLEKPGRDLGRLAATLQSGRKPMRFRTALSVRTQEELRRKLDGFADGSSDLLVADTALRRSEEQKSASSDGDAVVVEALESYDIKALARLWLEGHEHISWQKLHGGVSRKCSAPTYPFELEEFWFEEEGTTTKYDVDEVRSRSHYEDRAALAGRNGEQERQASEEKPELRLAGADHKEKFVEEIRSILSLPLNERVEDSTFIDLGVNSITAARFTRELSKRLGVVLPETLIFNYPTVKACAEYLANKPISEPSTSEPSPEFSRSEASHFMERLAEVMKESPEVVPLQTEGNGPFVFCIHPMSGDVGLYSKLADGASGRFRFIGIRSRGLLTDKAPLTSLAQMAAHYRGLVNRLRQGEDYHLFGSSLGGTICYEMLRQSQTHGEAPKSLVMVEPPLIIDEVDAVLWDTDDRSNWLMNANFLMISMLHLDPEFRKKKDRGEVCWQDLILRHEDITAVEEWELVDRLAEMVAERGVGAPLPALRMRLESMARIHLLNLRSLNKYRAQPLREPSAMPAVLLRTRTSAAVADASFNPDYLQKVQESKGSLLPFLSSWTKLIPQLRTRIVEAASHLEILSTPAAIQELLDATEEQLCQGQATSKPQMQTGVPVTSGSKKVAVVGMSARFPGAANAEEFWGLLREGKSGLTEVPQDRGWTKEHMTASELSGSGPSSRKGGFLSGIANFDAAFFQITPAEADTMDPAERLFLQESWKAVEDAGIDPAQLAGKQWGVFCGGGGDYSLHIKDLTGISPHVTASSIAGRVAYSMDLRGPVTLVDAGCASSLLAVAQACDQISLGNCEAAIAGGVLIYSTPNLLNACQYSGLLSADWGSGAPTEGVSRMIPGEGVASVVLKALDTALQDGDRIYGVIEGWGSNHNGRTNGMAAPSARAQVALMSGIYNRFAVDPSTITMLEANATGTPLGDALELEAFLEIFRDTGESTVSCALGSVESQIGHSFHCSGMAHLIKVLLALQSRTIPGASAWGVAKDELHLKGSRLHVPVESQPWVTAGGAPRRAALNSFGATGTNVHLVLREAPFRDRASLASTESALIVLSAQSAETLQQRCRDLYVWLQRHPELQDLQSVAANLLLKRAHFSERWALVTNNREELLQELKQFFEQHRCGRSLTGAGAGRLRPAVQRLAKTTIQNLCVGSADRAEDWTVLADLYREGYLPDLSEIFSTEDTYPLSLPGYPFRPERHWYEAVRRIEETSSYAIVEQLSSTERIIQELLTDITGFNAGVLKRDLPFSEFGLDSLVSMRFVAQLNAKCLSDLRAPDLAEFNTTHRLASKIDQDRLASSIAEVDQQQERADPVKTAIEGLPTWVAQRVARLPDQCLSVSVVPPNSDVLLFENLRKLSEAGVAVCMQASTAYAIAPASIDFEQVFATLKDSSDDGLRLEAIDGVLLAPVSQEQRRNLYHSEIQKSPALNLQHCYRLHRDVSDLAVLNEAMGWIVRNQDILRTGFVEIGGDWIQVISPASTVPIWPLELATKEDLYDFVLRKRLELQCLDNPPLLQAWISRVQGTYLLGLVSHHGIADAFTMPMLVSELLGYYDQLKAGIMPTLTAVKEQYWAYALGQNHLDYQERREAGRYWRTELEGCTVSMRLPYVCLPDDLDRAELDRADGNVLELSPELTDAIGTFVHSHEISLTHLFTCAIVLLLTQPLRNKVAVLRFINSQRDRASLIHTMGEFTNFLLVPFTTRLDATVVEVLREVKQVSLKGMRHAKADLSELLAMTGIRDLKGFYEQLGDVILDSADIDAATLRGTRAVADSLFVEALLHHGRCDLRRYAIATLFYQVLKVDQQIFLITIFREKLFDKREMQDMSQLLVRLVELMVRNPRAQVRDLLKEVSNDLELLEGQTDRTLGVERSRPTLKSAQAQDSGQQERFPELVRMGPNCAGRPVFWMHAGMGGVESYSKIAAEVQRPFYGIQARGWMSDRSPLVGVQAMATYYVDAIQSMQPAGPYDVGGYSLGGVLAYEVARQLQELHESVASIVMLDSFALDAFSRINLSYRSTLLQAVNMSLSAAAMKSGHELRGVLVHRDEISALDDETFSEELLCLAQQRGLKKSRMQLSSLLQQMLKVSQNFEISRYRIQPLLRSEEPWCVYFRNRRGLMYGELTPYFTCQDGEVNVDGEDHVAEWAKLIPGLHTIDVDASNHLVLLSEQESLQKIVKVCTEIYDGPHGRESL
jgi:acyl transferase domain-containing protein/thioesterase domain-containing protein/pyruvate/2-oxoglutarate dehydrogenase complex dihydrolipoamide acyltransferase (E2) component/non-ribosomal peptide synthetase component F/aryl carrier-like protein